MSKTKLINLTNKMVSPFNQPQGARYYPIAIVAPAYIMDDIVEFLCESSFTQQPDIYPLPKESDGYLPFDWLAFHTGGISDRLLWVCISERVYADQGFRLIIMEHLI